MLRNKKHEEEEHMDETWLIPYADLLTLLLALFIVLFAMSSIDAEKFKQMSEAFAGEFAGGTGVMEYPSPLPQEQMQSLNQEDLNNKPNTGPSFEQKELQELQTKMNNYIDSKNLNSELKTTLTEEGLMLTILDDVLFDSGSADVQKEDYQLTKEVSELLIMESPREVIISGHTDNVPIHNSEFESNWELSVMRSVNFMKILLENEQLDPIRFSAKGYGEFKPIASNETSEGRKLNRRVEILIKANTVSTDGLQNK